MKSWGWKDKIKRSRKISINHSNHLKITKNISYNMFKLPHVSTDYRTVTALQTEPRHVIVAWSLLGCLQNIPLQATKIRRRRSPNTSTLRFSLISITCGPDHQTLSSAKRFPNVFTSTLLLSFWTSFITESLSCWLTSHVSAPVRWGINIKIKRKS